MFPRTILPTANWQWLDSGRASAARQMEIDREILEEFESGELSHGIIRQYGWEADCITFGKRQDAEIVRALVNTATSASPEISRRPTGGGICFHAASDRAISIFIPRAQGLSAVRKAREWLCDEVARQTGGEKIRGGATPSPWCEERRSEGEIVKEGRKILALGLLFSRSVYLLQVNILGWNQKEHIL